MQVIRIYTGKKALSLIPKEIDVKNSECKLITNSKSYLIFSGDGIHTIDHIYTRPAFRGQGYARELIEYMKRFSCQTIATEESTPLFLKCGYLKHPENEYLIHYQIRGDGDIKNFANIKISGFHKIYYYETIPVAIVVKDECIDIIYVPSRFIGFEQRILAKLRSKGRFYRYAVSLEEERMLKQAGFLNYGPIFKSLPYYSYYLSARVYPFYFEPRELQTDTTLYGDDAAQYYLIARNNNQVEYNSDISRYWLSNMKKGYERILHYKDKKITLEIKSALGVETIW